MRSARGGRESRAAGAALRGDYERLAEESSESVVPVDVKRRNAKREARFRLDRRGETHRLSSTPAVLVISFRFGD